MNADARLLIPAGACWLAAALTVGAAPAWLATWCWMLAVGTFALGAALVLAIVLPSRIRWRRTPWLLRVGRGAGAAPPPPAAGVIVVSLAAAAIVFSSIGAQVGVRSPPSIASLDAHTVAVV